MSIAGPTPEPPRRPGRGSLPILLLALLLLPACGRGETSGAAVDAGAGRPAASSPAPGSAAGDAALARAALGEGFAAWESRRSGAWRIWAVDLAGGAPRQISPDEPGRNHCCAHASPDGRWVTYLSFEGEGREPAGESLIGRLHVVGPDGTGSRPVAPAARTYRGKRAAVWSDAQHLIYIDGAGYTVEQAIDGGEARRLTTEPAELYGWLINPTRTHATLGYPAYIVPYDAQRRRIVERAPFGGCEPYFTHDGSAAYWVAGAGGPLRRLDLATGETTTLIRKFDERLPDGFGYLYFPMTSADGSLLVWGASEGEHDQFQANYEIFAAPADPATLQLVGEPVRLTEESGTDRFPTVFARPLPLGRQRGEAPWTARFAAPGAGRWEFDFGDGAQATGGAVEHRYTQPGVYSVVARQGEQERVGQVRVLPAAPPRPQSATLAADAGAILVRFDEPVGTEGVEARLESGAAIAAIEAGADERELRFVLAEPRDGFDQIHLSGVPDRAEPPHVLAAATLPLEVPRWPSRREDLVLLWENGEAANLVADPDGGAERAVSLVPTGGALLDHSFRMRLGRGSFRIADEFGAAISRELQAHNEFGLTMVLASDGPTGDFAPILRSAGGRPDFQIGQRGDRLMLYLRVGARGPQAFAEANLLELPAGRPVAVAISYSPGRLQAWRDGELVHDSGDVQGDFFHWREQPWEFGGGAPAWRGTVEGVAIYRRALTPEQVATDQTRFQRLVSGRPDVPRSTVVARLRERSRTPTLDQITPYRDGLVVYEWEVEEVVAGAAPSRLRVAHWALLDGEAEAATGWREGRRARLELEPFAANRQLAPYFVSDTLPGEGAPPEAYAVAAEPLSR